MDATREAADAADRLDPQPRLNLVRWAGLTPEPVEWLPGGYVALSGLNIVAGYGGVGKTRLMMSLAAAVSTGMRWPWHAGACTDGAEAGGCAAGVLIVAGEDAVTSTLLPAFLAAGGDASYVASIESVFVPRRDGKGMVEAGFDLSPAAMAVLDETLAGGRYRLVIIDGITGYIEGDGKGDTETRRSLMPLARLLRQRRVAGVGLMHFNKAGGRAGDRLIQSVAFRNVARTVYYVVPDPAEDECPSGKPARPDFRRLVFNEKINVGRVREPFAYRIEDVEVPGTALRTGAVTWDPAPVACSLNDALAASDATPAEAGGGERTDPGAVLRAMLAVRGGLAPAHDLFAAAESVGIAERTLRYTRKKLDLPYRRYGFGQGAVFYWSLPGVALPDDLPTPLPVAGMENVAGMGEAIRGFAEQDAPIPATIGTPIAGMRDTGDDLNLEHPFIAATSPIPASSRGIGDVAGMANGAGHMGEVRL